MLARLALLVCLVAGLTACQGLPDLSIPQGTQPTPVGGAGSPAAAPGGPVAPVATPLFGTEETPQPVTLEVKVIEEEAETPAYRVRARYPYLTGGGSPYLADFNQRIETLVLGEIGRFAQEVSAGGGRTGLLTIDFLPTLLDPRMVSVQLKVTTFLQGAPHMNTTSRALNYDLQRGQPLALADLFQAGSPYLQTLSDASITDLRDRNVLQWEAGAQPREENFQVWNLTPEGLLITFDEYRVADYTAGPQTVLIPYDRLSEIANPTGPLSFLY